MKTGECGVTTLDSRKPFPGGLAFAACALLCIAVFTAQPVPARAQDRPPREISPEQVVSRLAERLDLTAEQEEKIRPIIEESAGQRRELMEEAREQRRETRSKMQEIENSTDRKLSEVLTDGQMEEYRNLREERRERRHRRRPGGGWERGERPDEETSRGGSAPGY